MSFFTPAYELILLIAAIPRIPLRAIVVKLFVGTAVKFNEMVKSGDDLSRQ